MKPMWNDSFNSDSKNVILFLFCFCYNLILQFFGEEADFSDLEKLYEEDYKRLHGLRKCHKLTRSHIWPNSFEKMVVPLATRVTLMTVETGE